MTWCSLAAPLTGRLRGGRCLTPGARLPSLTGNRVLYRDGVPVAVYAGGEVSFLEQLDEKEQWQARNALLRRQVPGVLADLA